MAWQRVARVTGAMVLVMAGALEAQAQQRPLRPGQTQGPNFLVPGVLRSQDKQLGQEVADVIRDRLMSDNMMTSMRVITKKDLVANLEQSGYSATDALTETDMRQLAQFIHAEEYIDGTVTRGADGTLTLNAVLMLPRGDGMEQPLPEVTGSRPGDIAARISREIDQARKQIKGANECLQSRRQRLYEDAKMHAGQAIKEYENSVMGRVCLLEVARDQQAPADTIIKIAEEILALHPGNSRALEIVVDQYAVKSAANPAYMDKYIDALQQLLAADPNNTSLKLAIANALASAGKMDMAKAVLDTAVMQNPGDPDLVGMQWRVYRSLGDWKGVIRIGEEMIRHDTAAADTVFWQQLVAAYVSDSQPVKAQEAAARGAAKFPNNETLWLSVAQLARQNGQLPMALDAINRLLAANPNAPGAYNQKAAIFNEQNNLDSLMVAARQAAAAGEDKTAPANMVLQKANGLLREYQSDTAKTVEGGDRILAILALSDSLNPTPTAGFLTAAVNVVMAAPLLTRASENRSCEDARRTDDMLIKAQELVRQHGREFGPAAGNIMNGAIQYQEYATRAVAAFCKN